MPSNFCRSLLSRQVPTDLSSGGGAVTVYVYDVDQMSLPTPFYSVLVSISVFMALLIVFHSTNSPHNSPFSSSVFFCFISALLVLSTI